MSVQRVSYGECKQCQRPVLYQGAEHCSPECYNATNGGETSEMEEKRLHRKSDPRTSVEAARRAAKASLIALQTVEGLMIDNVRRTDQEIWRDCRARGYITSLDTIQHGRLALSEAGLLVETGETRLTEDGMPSRVWVLAGLAEEGPVVGTESKVPRDTTGLSSASSERRSALITPGGIFRYLLARIWGPGPRVLFIGLNPSTADAEQDDPTVNWWREFARSHGYGGFIAANLFAFRTSDPKELKKNCFPVGPDNDYFLLEAAKCCSLVIACWGNSGGKEAAERGHYVERLLGIDGAADRSLLGID